MKEAFLQYHKPWIDDHELDGLRDVLLSGWLTMGPVTLDFERLLAQYMETKHAVVVSSCTAALHLSLIALGIREGDEVITVPFTFAATGNVIINSGAKPVFVDIDRKTYNIDPQKIEEAITPRTKAVIPVHYAGQPCDMKAITEISRTHNLFVIEDAAHAIGAKYENRNIGSFSEATCFSFYATKNITTGDGGAILTNDDNLADRLRILRLHGISEDAWKRYSAEGSWYYTIEDFGWKYNLTDIQSALGIAQLKKLDRFIEMRRKYARIYNEELSNIRGVITPYEKPEVKHAYHLYPILLEKHDRGRFVEQMYQQGIGCSVHFIPLHLHSCYQKRFGFKKGDFPNTEWVYEREVSLPLYPMMTEEDIYRVIKAVRICLE